MADALTGKTIPSGKLTDTWAAKYGDYPSSAGFSGNDGDVDDEYYTEGIYVGYRYFDTFGVKPLYCFGYGLSYTQFSMETLRWRRCAQRPGAGEGDEYGFPFCRQGGGSDLCERPGGRRTGKAAAGAAGLWENVAAGAGGEPASYHLFPYGIHGLLQ